jgi:hypothetical protein
LLSPRDLTVRIIVEASAPLRVVRVEGRLTAAEVSELDGALGDDLCQVRLCLEHLRSADAAGIAALRRLRDAGVVLCGTPPTIGYDISGDNT